MEAEILRAFLIAVGILVVVGLYFWDRLQRRRRTERSRQRRKDPVLVDSGEEPRSGADAPLDEPQDAYPELEREISVDPGAVPRANRASAGRDGPSPVSSQKREHEPKSKSGSPSSGAATVDVPEKFIQLSVVASPERSFSGSELFAATASVGLTYGPMKIFHRHAREGGAGKVVYCVANLVEPGTFPAEDVEQFSTPGITLFMRLPGTEEGMAIFSDMLGTGERLASILGGELQDQSHSSLTRQTVEHIREEIMEHSRQVKLALMRR